MVWRYFELSNTTCKRFTDRARLTLALAEQFAFEQRVQEIEPEHILRGLASGGRGVGRTALEKIGIDLFRLLPQIVELLPPYPEKPLAPVDEMLANPSKCSPDPFLGVRSLACLEAARAAASELQHNYYGSEHLVLGVINTESAASAFLKARGATAQLFRDAMAQILYGDGC